MKKIFLLTAISIFLLSCKKDKPEPSESDDRKPEVIIRGLTESLASADSISQFTAALKNLSLTAEETAQGITVFAPLNETNTALRLISKVSSTEKQAGMNVIAEGSPGQATSTEVKDHLVKGVLTLNDLSNGKTLNTLSGKQLKITRSADTIWINGVRIGGKQIVTTENQTVYTVKSSLSPTSPANELQMGVQELLTALSVQERNISTWHKNLAVADGLLSHQAVIDSIPAVFRANFQPLGLFTFNPSTTGITRIWQDGYNQISALSSLLNRAPGNLPNRTETLARIRAMRAYVYLQLLSYYGSIPLWTKPGELGNSSRATVYDFVVSEFQATATLLPQTSPSKSDITAGAVKALEAKAALLDRDYAKVNNLTSELIAGGWHSLASNAAKFSTNSSEIIWNNTANFDSNFKSYFMNRETLPYIRLTEVYLMGIEAALRLGNIPKAQDLYQTLMARSGGTGGQQVTLTSLKTFWQTETRREGHAFLNMVRWETASEALSGYGYQNHHNRLPIPQLIIDQNPNMVQNPGY